VAGRDKMLRSDCKMTIHVEGMMVRPEGLRCAGNSSAPGPFGIVPIDDIVNVSQAAAIEIYATAAHAPGALVPLTSAVQQGACGIVAIWTGGRR
jgi:hypothetical protein